MPSPWIGALSLLGAALAWTSPAAGEALTLWELDELTTYVECQGACAVLSPNTETCTGCYEECLGVCPETRPEWEKNGVPPINDIDLYLAIYEFLDDGSSELICYHERPDGVTDFLAVVPEPLCDACTDDHSVAECTDADSDGIPAWVEAQINGGSDGDSDSPCLINGDCPSQEDMCVFRYELGRKVCLPRWCGGEQCTVFHLEQVSVDNQELIVQIHYDYSTVPAFVLDLRLTYDDTALTLIDARPLPALDEAGKHLYVSHLADDRLRIVVLSAESMEPIPFGPIIELVFQRISMSGTTVAFALDDFSQTHSMAPEQGNAQDELAEDDLWGSEISILGAVSTGDRLLLHLSFDNPTQPFTYKDVPSAAALCQLIPDCANEADGSAREAAMLSQLALLQAGVVDGQELLGVTGKGLYLDGINDHVGLPVTVDDTGATSFEADEQSFSFASWFFTEGLANDQTTDDFQLLFSHLSAMEGSRERTKWGLLLAATANPQVMSLRWFDQDVLVGTIASIPIADVDVRHWTHVGLTFDAGSGVAQVYVDGLQGPAISQGVEPGTHVFCPGELTGGGVDLTLEGSGGAPPERLFYSAGRSNLQGIEQMDLLGAEVVQVLREGGASNQHPDYSPITDKIVYSSNASGSFEIWIADRAGTEASRRQITKGFGDSYLGIAARNPRWAPDGSGIVFESNAYYQPAGCADENHCGDNLQAHAYQLYYIPFDPIHGTVAIPLGGHPKPASDGHLKTGQLRGLGTLTRALGTCPPDPHEQRLEHGQTAAGGGAGAARLDAAPHPGRHRSSARNS